jgi:hypothetical protein
MSKVISASSAMDVSESTAAVAAVVEVLSFASMVSLVESTLNPLSFISTVGIPDVDAVDKEALGTLVKVIAKGARKDSRIFPVVIAVFSSDKATVMVCSAEFTKAVLAA